MVVGKFCFWQYRSWRFVTLALYIDHLKFQVLYLSEYLRSLTIALNKLQCIDLTLILLLVHQVWFRVQYLVLSIFQTFGFMQCKIALLCNAINSSAIHCCYSIGIGGSLLWDWGLASDLNRWLQPGPFL